jgi:2,3-diketo-5-methylthiopentyl-1-phosphate enolase
MAATILYPDSVELMELSDRVTGLVTASYSFNAVSQSAAEKTAIQIATGQTLGYQPENLDYYADYVGRVTKASWNDGSAEVNVVFPAKLFGTDMAGLLTVLFGKISFYPNLRLDAVSADARYLASLRGPRFGLDGIKKIALKAESKLPLLMAILKPGIGPSNDVLAEQYAKLIEAGTDLESVLTAANGKGIYVTHLTGPAFDLARRAKQMQNHGAKAFLFCPFTYGLSALQSLCQDPEIKVPIFAHPAFTGPITSGASAASARVVLGTILRWAGCDAVLFPSPYGSIALPKAEALHLHQSLTCQQGDLKVVGSVPSAGIVPELVSSIREDFGANVIVNAGTGMMRSGGSIPEGVQAFKRMIEQSFNV